jgi:hypothetical protein
MYEQREPEIACKLGFLIGAGVVGLGWLALVALHHFAGI